MNESLRRDFLELLHKHTRNGGLTYAAVGRKCGKQIQSNLAAYLGKKAAEARLAEQVKNLVFDLWMEGLDLMVPPRGRQTTPRLQHPEFLAKRRQLKTATANAGSQSSVVEMVSPTEVGELRQAYQAFLPEHPSGAVNIYKIRRKLAWKRDVFDRHLRQLSAQRNPPFQFVGGDPHDFSSDEQHDSLFQDGQLYFSILWRG